MMTTIALRVLLIEDCTDDADLLVLELRRGGYDPTWLRVETPEEMRGALDAGPWDVVLSDYTLPLFSGLGALRMAKESDPDLPFILVSGAIGEDVAVEAMRLGADDYLLKQSLARLAPAVWRELREAADRRGRRRAEQDAHQLAAIIQGCDDAIWGRSLAGLVTSWNPGAERLYGYTAAEIVGKHSSLLIPADRPEELQAMMDRIKSGERIDSFETERLRKDGTRVQVSVTVSPVTDAAGNLVAASTIARDITEKRQAEEALRRQARLLQSVLASVGDGVAGADEQGRFLVFNEAATAILGVGKVDTDPAHWPHHYGLFLPDGLTPYPAHRVPLFRASRGEAVTDEEMVVRNAANPHGRWISVNGTPLLDEHGGKQGGVVVFRDITERKKAEQEFARRALILSNVRDSVIVTELDGVVTYWNEGATRLFGWTAKEMLGHPLADSCLQPVRPSVAGQILSLASGEELVGEFDAYRQDDSRVWIDAQVARIKDAAGVSLGARFQ